MKVLVTCGQAHDLIEVRDSRTNRVLAIFSAFWQAFRYCHSMHFHMEVVNA